MRSSCGRLIPEGFWPPRSIARSVIAAISARASTFRSGASNGPVQRSVAPGRAEALPATSMFSSASTLHFGRLSDPESAISILPAFAFAEPLRKIPLAATTGASSFETFNGARSSAASSAC
jgi:hypothetical protein